MRIVLRWLPLLVVLCLCGYARADRVEELTKTLIDDPSYKVRVQAALVLGKLADARAVPALSQALMKDDNETVRGVSAASLGYLGDRTAAGALKAALNDKSSFVVAQAKKALSMLGISSGDAMAGNA